MRKNYQAACFVPDALETSIYLLADNYYAFSTNPDNSSTSRRRNHISTTTGNSIMDTEDPDLTSPLRFQEAGTIFIKVPDDGGEQSHVSSTTFSTSPGRSGKISLETTHAARPPSICPPFYEHMPLSEEIPEHFRDIPGCITLHRVFLLAYYILVPYCMYLLQNQIWPLTNGPQDKVWAWLSIFLFVPLPSVFMWIIGSLWFSHNTRLDRVRPNLHKVIFRIVSRGTNAECLLATVRKCQFELRKAPLFPYLIEIVTDGEEFIAPGDADILHLKVPNTYQTPNESRFKARALHYACIASIVPPESWVVHLDEETQLTTSAIKGIADMVAKTEASGNVKKVGQGCILYHRAWGVHPFLTLADMRRTGDDIGHFYLQHRLGFTIFGLHGSYVVVRADVERDIGFDVGPDGSITEDAWWILLALERGVRTCWVDGYMDEQSTQSMKDFLKQRRRWYVGLWKVGTRCPVPLGRRIFMLYNTLCWIVLPIVLILQILYVIISIALQKQIVLVVRILTSVMAATSFAVYLTGLLVNMWEHGTPWYRVPLWILLQILLFPVFYVMEAIAIFMTFFSPLSANAKGFHVVAKSDHPDAEVREGPTNAILGKETDSHTSLV